MKKTIFWCIALLCAMTVISCGPSAEEIAAREKAKIDSVAKATEEMTRLKLAEEKRIADSIATAKIEKEELIRLLSDARTELRIANEKLESIKGFHFGRLESEKNAQIEEQYKVIQTWEDEIERVHNELKKYE